MITPVVSVLMPVYNSGKFLSDAIKSILNQTLTDFELIIIDDGSTDESLAIAKYYSELDSRVSVYNQKNKGISLTRNRLLSLSKAKYIAWMDSDDVSLPDRLLNQYGYLQENANIIAVGCKTELIDEKENPLCLWNSPTSHTEIDKLHISGNGGAIIFSSAMMRKDAVLSAGGFDENLTGAEDLCLFLRLAEVGELANIDKVGLLYRQHLKSISHNSKKTILNDKAKVIEAACKRRGIKNYVLNDKDYHSVETHHIFNKWAWWALNDGNVSTSRKYAIMAIIKRPHYLAYWKTLYCACRGY